jgi:hypothetical protein
LVVGGASCATNPPLRAASARTGSVKTNEADEEAEKEKDASSRSELFWQAAQFLRDGSDETAHLLRKVGIPSPRKRLFFRVARDVHIES